MRKFKLMHNFIIILVVCLVSGCGQKLGTRLEFNGGELFYTSSVTEEEAIRLGTFLVIEEFYDGNEKSVQLNKSGETYEFRMIISEEEIKITQEVKAFFKLIAQDFSTHVFHGNEVEVHLCDENFQTICALSNLPK